MNIYLDTPRSLWDWLTLWRLYRRCFPPSERKPFAHIRRQYRLGRWDVWCIRSSRRLLGFASTVNSPELILLDYFAVSPRYQGRGIGARALAFLLEHYRDKGLFVEIEAVPPQACPENIPLRRREFYRRLGLLPLGVTAEVFGVPMELLGRNCALDFEDYRRFYHDRNSPWAAEHILPLEEKGTP